MKISLYLERQRKHTTVELPAKATVLDLLQKLQINPVTVLVTRGDDLLLEDAVLKDNDSLEIRSVVSGG